jgi:hypothetical protein
MYGDGAAQSQPTAPLLPVTATPRYGFLGPSEAQAQPAAARATAGRAGGAASEARPVAPAPTDTSGVGGPCGAPPRGPGWSAGAMAAPIEARQHNAAALAVGANSGSKSGISRPPSMSGVMMLGGEESRAYPRPP